MEKWFVAAKKADFDGWAAKFRISPVLARIIRNRDITTEEEVRRFLYGTLEDCHSPWKLLDMEKAVTILGEEIRKGTAIRVIGDYDVDGICSAYILTKGLTLLGANVDTAIPHRIHDGYGLNEHLIREAAQDGIGLIVTCDNGIAAADQIRLANELGIRVIVTDHHEVPYELKDGKRTQILPPAAAVIDPKQEGDTYPFPGICGGVVAYKVIQALAQQEGIDAGEEKRLSSGSVQRLRAGMEEFLEFAALSTVCDVMELKDENRILVKEGLKRLRRTVNPGLKALMEVCGIEPEMLSAYHLGFVLGPCLNATGRLDTAERALELLQSKEHNAALIAARELKDLNESRKNLTAQGVKEAEEFLQKENMLEDKVYVIYLPGLHESLAGIVAGKIKEVHHHPVFVLTQGEEGVKGSGRSVEGYHMYEALTGVNDLLTRFGGHKMAAGVSMEECKIDQFRHRLNENCELSDEDFVQKVHIDVPMPMTYVTDDFADQMELLEPFGVGNPKPLFAERKLIFSEARPIGKNRQYTKFRVLLPDGESRQMIYFGNTEKFCDYIDETLGIGTSDSLFAGRIRIPLNVVYQIGKNTFQGRTEIQYLLQYYC